MIRTVLPSTFLGMQTLLTILLKRPPARLRHYVTLAVLVFLTIIGANVCFR